MITIFNGRRLSLTDARDDIYVQVSAELRDHIAAFNDGKSLNPFGVFMVISLHADALGWAWPGRELISRETGISTPHAIAGAINHLLDMRLDRQRVLGVWRERLPGGRWGRTFYRIFPDAFSDEEAVLFPPHEGVLIARLRDEPDAPPCVGKPHVAEPHVAQPHAVNPHSKYSQVKLKPEEERSVLPAELDFTAGAQTPATPRRLLGDNGHPTDHRQARSAALNAELAPALRLPLANALLAVTGLTALADTDTVAGDNALNGAHESAVALYKMGITSPDLLAPIITDWRGTWQAKDGNRPTNKQLVDHASKWLDSQAASPTRPASDAGQAALPETFPGMEP